MSDRLSQKCEELGVSEESFRHTRKGLRRAQDAAKKANDAMEADLTALVGLAPEKEIKELRQAAEIVLIDTIMKSLIEE